MNQIIRAFPAGVAWYIPAGSTTGEFPINQIVLSNAIPNDRGHQYVGGTLYVADEAMWPALVEINQRESH